MKLRTQLFIIVLGGIAVFASLNWQIFITPTNLSLGFVEVEAPLGLVMLGLLVFLTVLFLIFTVSMQGAALIDTYRHSRNLKSSRALAESTETSRFTELREVLAVEMKRQENLTENSKVVVMARLDKLELDLCSVIEQAAAKNIKLVAG